jgi:hypothetical protein
MFLLNFNQFKISRFYIIYSSLSLTWRVTLQITIMIIVEISNSSAGGRPSSAVLKEIFCLWSWVTSLHWPLLAEATQLNEQIFIYIYIYIYIWPLAEKRCSKAIPCLATSFGKLLRNKNSYFMAIKLWYLNFK